MLLDAAVRMHAQDVEMVAELVFSTMMGLAIRPVDAPFAGPSGLLTAAVYLTGEREGAVCVHCTAPQACELAGRFVGLPTPPSVDDDVRDVMGELANMIAGNLKCTFAPGMRVSIPTVTDGEGYTWRVTGGARVVYQGAFQTDSGIFWITLIEAANT